MSATTGTGSAQVRFRVTPADVADASQANLWWRFTRWSSLLPALALATGVAAVTGLWLQTGSGTEFAVPYAMVGAVILLARVGVYLAAPWMARRTWRQQKSLQLEYEVTVTPDGMRARTATSDHYVAWADYLAWQEGPRSLLVYQSEHLYQFIPKAAATPEFMAAFRSGVAALRRRG